MAESQETLDADRFFPKTSPFISSDTESISEHWSTTVRDPQHLQCEGFFIQLKHIRKQLKMYLNIFSEFLHAKDYNCYQIGCLSICKHTLKQQRDTRAITLHSENTARNYTVKPSLCHFHCFY